VFVLPGSENAVELATEEGIAEEAPHLAGLAIRHTVGGTEE
jgi:molybdenum cofactor biosynthesis protein B